MNKLLEIMTSQSVVLRKRNPFKQFFREYGFAYLLLAPAVVYLLAFQFYPLFETVRLSMYQYSLVAQKGTTFVGLGNYSKLLFEDEHFWKIFWNSVIWVFGSTIFQFVIAIPAALILNVKLRSRGLWRGLMMVPWVSPVVIIGIIWKWIYDGQFGLANHYMKMFQVIQENVVWLGHEVWVWPALLLTSTWKGFPYITLMLLSGLSGVSKEMLEAAHVDGANVWQRFTQIVLPLLRPIIYVTGLVCIVASWTKFEMIWALTNGGPGYATSVLPTYVYTHAFVYFDLGLGSAIATLSMILVLIFVAIYAKLFGRNDD